MTYADEYQTVLQRIADDNPSVRSLPYFLNTASQWHARYAQGTAESVWGNVEPRVVVLGYGIPEQLIYACGVTPYFVLGGSHVSCKWSDDVMPRDSDPASRSILGYALRLAETNSADPLFVVPVANDNMRKIAYLLKREGHSVLAVDIPPEVASIPAQRAWESSMHNLVQTVRQHVGKRVTAKSIWQADLLVGGARAAMLEFQRTFAQCDGVLSSEASLLVLNTYYQTSNLAQWTEMVWQLTAEVRARYRSMPQSDTYAPRVLVVGSPMLFPQYKVASLIHDAGLSLLAAVDAASTSRFANLAAGQRGSASFLINAIACRHYIMDSSSAHVVNRAMEQYVEHLLSETEVDGVVCHVLKGQIEYDFELARMEPLFERLGVPVFRLETDYQYQDVEQLRIRLEAFAEMLEQRAFAASQPSRRLRYA